MDHIDIYFIHIKSYLFVWDSVSYGTNAHNLSGRKVQNNK